MGYRPLPILPTFILMPELKVEDVRFLNFHMQLAGAKTKFLDKLRPPPGRSGVSSASLPIVYDERIVVHSSARRRHGNWNIPVIPVPYPVSAEHPPADYDG